MFTNFPGQLPFFKSSTDIPFSRTFLRYFCDIGGISLNFTGRFHPFVFELLHNFMDFLIYSLCIINIIQRNRQKSNAH